MGKLRLRRTSLLAVLISLLVLGIALPVSADAGPKPSMEFTLDYAIDGEPAIASAVLYECDNPDCRNAVAMEEMGPQGIRCSEDSCRALAYSFEDYFRLELTFEDGTTRTSNIFEKTRFAAFYTVTVRETDLDVQKAGGLADPFAVFLSTAVSVALFCIAVIVLGIMGIRARDTEIIFRNMPVSFIIIWIIGALGTINGALVVPTLPLTFALEGSILIGYAISQKEPVPTWLTLAFGINLITQPLLILALIFSGGGGESFWVLIIAEVLVFTTEMGILRLIKRQDLGWVQAALISLIINAASFGIGLILPV